MSPRHSAKTSSRAKRALRAKPASQRTEVGELARLLAQIRARLSGLSQAYGEPANFGLDSDGALTRQNRDAARVEAQALYRLVQTGRDSIENVRGLIAVPATFEQGVKEVRFSNPTARKTLLASLQFRKQVLKEFESLLVADHPAAAAVAAAGSGNR